jgi:hypothetical protein
MTEEPNEVGVVLKGLMEARGIEGPQELAAAVSGGRYEFSAEEIRRVLEGEEVPSGPLRYCLLVGLDLSGEESYDLAEAFMSASRRQARVELAERRTG